MIHRRGRALKKESENSDIRQISAEESAYIARLYQRYHKTLLRFLQRMDLDAIDASDIAQEAFYRVSRKENFTRIERPRAFLFRTAVNLVADLNRHNSRRHANQHFDIDMLEASEALGASPSLERVVQGWQRIDTVRTALRELQPNCMDVFTLFKFEGFSQAEIARRMNISVSMVEKHVVKALTHIRRRLVTTDRSSSVVRLAETGNHHKDEDWGQP